MKLSGLEIKSVCTGNWYCTPIHKIHGIVWFRAHNGPGQQLNNRIPLFFRAGGGKAKQDNLFHHGACTQCFWEMDVSFFSNSLSPSQARAQRQLVVPVPGSSLQPEHFRAL